jgi:hypothetical protein
MSPLLHRILSLGIAPLALVLSHGLTAAPAAAQVIIEPPDCIPDGVSCGDSIPPTMTISPTGTVTSSPVMITVQWCDDGALEPGSRIIEIDGVDRTAEFSFSRVTAPGCDDAAKSQASIALSPGTHAVYAYICDGSYSGPNCADSTASLTFDDKLPAQLSTAPHNGDYRNAALCVAGCFDATASYTTPAYVSLDQPWALTLFYSSAQAQPRGVVQIDATDNSATPPEKMSLALKRPDGTWVRLTNGATEVFYRSGPGHEPPGGPVRCEHARHGRLRLHRGRAELVGQHLRGGDRARARAHPQRAGEPLRRGLEPARAAAHLRPAGRLRRDRRG